MDKKFCDLCSREIPIVDMRKLKVETPDGKPLTKEKEICVFCKEKLINLLNNWRDACISPAGAAKPATLSSQS
jgi:hypothetical protein